MDFLINKNFACSISQNKGVIIKSDGMVLEYSINSDKEILLRHRLVKSRLLKKITIDQARYLGGLLLKLEHFPFEATLFETIYTGYIYRQNSVKILVIPARHSNELVKHFIKEVEDIIAS